MSIDFVKCGLRVEAQGWKKRKRSVREKKENEKQGQAKEKDRKRKGTVSQANDNAPAWSCKKKRIDFSDTLAMP